MPIIVTNDGYGQMCNKIFNQMNVLATGLEKNETIIYYDFDKFKSFKYFEKNINALLTIADKNRFAKYKLFLQKKVAKFKNHYLLINSQFSSEKFLEKKIDFSKKIYVSGWPFINLKSLRKYKKEISTFFSPTEEMQKYVNIKLESIKNDNILVGIHIRRGDYRNWRDGKYYFNDNIYKSYICQFVKNFPNKRVSVFLFSNEKLNLENFYDERYDLIIPNGSPEEDFHLLSNMNYIIGPPSTFSGVASYLKDVPRYVINKIGQSLELNDMKIWLMETDCDGNVLE